MSIYRKSLTPKEQASLPARPTGPMPISGEELRAAVGGMTCKQAGDLSVGYATVAGVLSVMGNEEAAQYYYGLAEGVSRGACS
jgi:mersacidin/lichenicidin family type 2 lantibiotic